MSKDIRVILGKFIEQNRKKLNLTQKQLSKKAGLHNSAACYVENMSANPSFETVNKLFQALDVSFHSFELYYINYGGEV